MLFVANDTLLFSEGWEGNTIITYFLSSSSFNSQDSEFLIDRYLSYQSNTELSTSTINLLINRELTLNSILNNTVIGNLNVLRELYNTINQSIDIDNSNLNVLRELYNTINQSIDIDNSNLNVLRELYNTNQLTSESKDISVLIERILSLKINQDINLSDAMMNFILVVVFLVNAEIENEDINLSIERLLSSVHDTESILNEISILVKRLISININKISDIINNLTIQRELKTNTQLSSYINDTNLLIARFLKLTTTSTIEDVNIDTTIIRDLTKSINESFLIEPFNNSIKRDIYTKHNLYLNLNDIKSYAERILNLIVDQGIVYNDSNLTKILTTLFKCETEQEVGNFLLSIVRDLQSNLNVELTINQIRLYLFAITQFNRLAMKIIIDKYNMRDLSDDMRFTDYSDKITIEDFTCEEEFKDLSDNTDIQIIT